MFFEEDDGRRSPAEMLNRIKLILSVLQAASTIEAMDVPTFRLHPLNGT